MCFKQINGVKKWTAYQTVRNKQLNYSLTTTAYAISFYITSYTFLSSVHGLSLSTMSPNVIAVTKQQWNIIINMEDWFCGQMAKWVSPSEVKFPRNFNIAHSLKPFMSVPCSCRIGPILSQLGLAWCLIWFKSNLS